MSSIPIDTYNKLKTEYLSYRNQSEETLKDYQKTIKLLRDSNDTLKRENYKLKLDQSTKDQSKEIKKLKEDKLILSRQLMDLESEAIAYKDKPIDMLLPEKLTIDSFSFSLNIINTAMNKQVIKDNLKNKNEEILILKNELVKKDKAMIDFIKKQRENYIHLTMLKPIKIINDTPLYRNKSDNDFIKTIILTNTRKYFDSTANQLKRGGKAGLNSNNKPSNKRKGNDMKSSLGMENKQGKMVKRQSEELSLSMGDEYDDDGYSTLEKNISQEIKNILEEKRNFIIQTMTYENFSFDITSSYNRPINKAGKNNNNASIGNPSSINSNNQQLQNRICQNIDEFIIKIKNRKGVVDSQRRKLENMLNQFEISIN